MKFNELKLEKNILKALKEAGYSEPTPIQQQAIPPVLEGRDLMGCAQTGTGKTCAFAVPIIQRLAKSEGRKGHHPCAHPHADARACAADLRKRVPVRALHAVQCGGHLRRRIAGAAGRGNRTRCGHSHCHAGPSVGFDGPEDRKAGQGRVFACSTRPTACSTWVSRTTL